MSSVRKLIPVVLALGLLVGTRVASAQAASIWTPLASGTTDTISSVVYQSPTRLWYATTNSQIAYWNSATRTFDQATGILPGEDFVSMAFQPAALAPTAGPGTSGLYGFAVTTTGDVWRSSDGGESWTSQQHALTNKDCAVPSASNGELTSVTELNRVIWVSGSTAYLLGNDGTMLKSTDANNATAHFTEINKVGTGTCAATNNTDTPDFDDAVFETANPSDAFVIGPEDGMPDLYGTNQGFVSGNQLDVDPVGPTGGVAALAIDQSDPSQLWAADQAAGGASCGAACLTRSTDGGTAFTPVTYPQHLSSLAIGLYGISSQGGVEVAAGSGGTILTSIDGTNFYDQPAAGSLATENWRAEDAYDSAHAAVGGPGGALAVTAQANTIPSKATGKPTPRKPHVSTIKILKRSTHTAHLTVKVDPEGLATKVKLVATHGTHHVTSKATKAGDGTVAHTVHLALRGLKAHTKYKVRAVATNSAGHASSAAKKLETRRH